MPLRIRIPGIRLIKDRLYLVTLRVNLNPFTVSQFMYSECCHAPVMMFHEFIRDADYVVCMHCSKTQAVVPREDKEAYYDKGTLPPDVFDPARHAEWSDGIRELFAEAFNAYLDRLYGDLEIIDLQEDPQSED